MRLDHTAVTICVTSSRFFFLALRLNGLCVFILVVILVGLEALDVSLSRLVSLVADRMLLCGYTGKV